MTKIELNVRGLTLSICFENEQVQVLTVSKMNLYAQQTNWDTLSHWLL